jgi:hypothetical protein
LESPAAEQTVANIPFNLSRYHRGMNNYCLCPQQLILLIQRLATSKKVGKLFSKLKILEIKVALPFYEIISTIFSDSS